MKNRVVVVVPIYKPSLEPLEFLSLRVSLVALIERPVIFIGPENLDLAFYREQFGQVNYRAYPPEYFGSIPGYNRLLLSHAFYRAYADYEFMMILQTDALILRDELDEWSSRPFDYVGAPWPDGVELFVNAGRFDGANGKRVKVHVGNGGLSLRRISKTISLLDEFSEVTPVFERTGSSEDLFFAFMGALSTDFIIPNEITASRFSMELKPTYYHAVNGGVLPMGGHAWWKYEPQFWKQASPVLAQVLP